MGVLDRTKVIPGLGAGGEEEPLPFICLACETGFEVQHHSCPACGCFDIRRSKWVEK